MNELSEKQERIVELWEGIQKKIDPLLKKAIEQYTSEYGMTYEDMWLWATGTDSKLSLYRYCTSIMPRL